MRQLSSSKLSPTRITSCRTPPAEPNMTRCSGHDRHQHSRMRLLQSLNRSKQAARSSRTSQISSRTRRAPELALPQRRRMLVRTRTACLGMFSRKCAHTTSSGSSHFDPLNSVYRLAPEVAHVRPWWSWVGGGAGATLGYIIANVPGAVAGGAWAANGSDRRWI
jgi:hypothetical protein